MGVRPPRGPGGSGSGDSRARMVSLAHPAPASEAQGPTPAAQRAEAEELTRMEREWARVIPKRDCLQRAAACFASTAAAIPSGSCAAHSPCDAQPYPAFGNPSDPPRIPRDLRPSQHWGRPGQTRGTRLVSIACPGSCELKGFGPNPSRNSAR